MLNAEIESLERDPPSIALGNYAKGEHRGSLGVELTQESSTEALYADWQGVLFTYKS